MRPILGALGCVTWIGLGCGGAVVPGSEYLDEMGNDNVGQAGSTAAGGGTGGRSSTDGGGTGGRSSGGGGTGDGGTGGRGSGGGGSGGIAGSAGTAGTSFGGDGGTGFGGDGGTAGSAGSAGSGGVAGAAGAASLEPNSICLTFDNFSLPSSAFPVERESTARTFCGGAFSEELNYQIICLPRPPAGLSCGGFYPEDLIGDLYSCGPQGSADFLCGPQTPPAGSDGCVGNECCYVLAGGC